MHQALPLISFCQFITHIRQKADFLIFHSEPMVLIHVPAVKDTGVLTEQSNQKYNDARSLRFRWHPHGKYHAGHWGAA